MLPARNVVRAGPGSLEVLFCELGDSHERAQQSGLQRSISMNRNDDSFPPARHRENVVTAVNSGQDPAAPFDNSREFATRNLLHTATSMI